VEAFARDACPSNVDALNALSNTASLTASDVLDSIQYLELLTHLEVHFGVEIEMHSEDPLVLTSIAGLATSIEHSRVQDS